MVKSIPNKSERGGNIYDFIGMAKEVSIPRDEGVNQNIEYLDYKEALNLYESIMSSDVVSSNIKERIKKIHEFFFYQ